ncbi:MAG: TIGR03619 family F420-dependent LLM class oxidoreductase [Pseudomonadales bacterium]
MNMKLGVTLRNMGPQSAPATMLTGARRAEAAGFESVWITDHIAIPPDDAEGSGGRYTDPLTTLAWLGGATSSIKLGVGVLILPYRPVLPTAKQIATVHELTGERLLLGVGIGWMDAEFKALGVARRERGRQSDEMLAFLAECFANQVVSRNGQAFIFDPRPPAPPIYVGGSAPQALRRALRFGHGWMPMARDPQKLARDLETFRDLAARDGSVVGPVTAMAGMPLQDPGRARAIMDQYQQLGVERLVCGLRYASADEYAAQLDALAAVRDRG